MKTKTISLSIISSLSLLLSSCYIPQNFTQNIEVSRTGQYQSTLDADVIFLMYYAVEKEAQAKKLPIEKQKAELQEVDAVCKKELSEDLKKYIKAQDVKYLGQCKFHIHGEYSGNIIKEKNATIGFMRLSYNQKLKQIKATGSLNIDKQSQNADSLTGYTFDGKLSIKTDGKVIETNAQSKPYWSLFGAYKWNPQNFNEANPEIVISNKVF